MWSSNHDTRENGAIAIQKHETPKVLSIGIVGPSLTKAASVQFMVQFSAHVTDFDIRAFRLVTSGSACGVVNSVLRLGGDACLVTVDDVSGAGSMGLALDADMLDVGAITGAVDRASYTIDRVASTVRRLTVPANGRYRVGQELDFGVSYDVPISVHGGKPSLTIAFPCGRSVQANLFEVIGAQLTFRHTVTDGDIQVVDVAWGRKIHLNGATMQDDAGNSVDTTLRGTLTVSQMMSDHVDKSSVRGDQSAFELSSDVVDRIAAYA